MKERKSPPGYKKTEIGIIPEDWKVKKLGDLAKFQNGVTLEKYFNKKAGFNVISIGNFSEEGKFIDDGNRISNKYYKKLKKFILHKDNLAMILNDKTSYGRIIGRAIYIDEDDKYIFNQRTMRIIPSEEIYPLFLYYRINSARTHNYIFNQSKPGTQIYINTQDVINIPIIFPPTLAEQQAIARVLSDFDRLIESLDKLIEKKKNIKKGAMQLLLTGKKRLPGFKGKWVRKRLGEIGEIAGAGVDKKIRQNEIPVRLLNYLDVYNRDFLFHREINFWTTAPKTKIEQCSIKKGDIFFTPSSELQTDIAISAVAMEDFKDVVYSYHIIRFRLEENWDLKFRTYIFKTKEFLEQAERMAEGSGKRYVISLKNFRELEIKYPSDINEQRAIAQILSNMDAEIEALERKKQKYEMMKKGVMELLLTGKVRLKFNNKEIRRFIP